VSAPVREPVRVLVVDDHPIVRQGIVALLAGSDDFVVVGQASDGDEGVRSAAALAPDLVVMDLRMPGATDGVAATRAVLRARPATRVVVLTTYETDDSLLAAIEAGASGYLLKAAPAAELLAGLRAVVAGQVALAPSMAAVLVTRARGPVADDDASPLTRRETQVLELVADGCSNPEIGRRLFIGEATVKTHLLHVFEKLGVADRTRAVTLALERGWLPRPGA